MVKKKLNFRIVEVSESDRDYEHLYDDFKKDYLNPDMYVKDIVAKYDIPPYIYREWSARVREEEGLARKPHCRFGSSPYITPNRYIYRLSKCYGIHKEIDGYKEYFGKYEDLETARLVRDKLVEANWDRNVADELIKEYGYVKKTGANPDVLMPKYDDFKHMYLDEPTKYQDILERLNINAHGYTWLLHKLREEYGKDIKKNKLRCYDPNHPCNQPKIPKPKVSKVKQKPMRYLHKQRNGKYTVTKVVDGVQRCFGTYSNLKSAKARRNKLERNGWQT